MDWRKGCPVNTIENAHIYLVLAAKATVSTTAFWGHRGLAIEPRILGKHPPAAPTLTAEERAIVSIGQIPF